MLQINSVNQGDCLELMKDISDKSIDMVLTDLPYNKTGLDWDKSLDLQCLWLELERLMKDESCVCFTANQPFTSKLVMSKPEWFKHEWIWEKTRGFNIAFVKREPLNEHESVLIFSKKSWKYNPIMQQRKGTGSDRVNYKFNWKGFKNHNTGFKPFSGNANKLRYPCSIQKFPSETGLHPTQKPVKLFEYLIKTYTNEGDLVLDCCAGSGTSAIACLNTNRNYICIEKEQKYFDIMRERIAKTMKPLETFN